MCFHFIIETFENIIFQFFSVIQHFCLCSLTNKNFPKIVILLVA